MILFFIDSYDISSGVIAEWLSSTESVYEIISASDPNSHIEILKINSDDFCIKINKKIIALKDISAIFYRRSGKIIKEEFILQNVNPKRETKEETIHDYLYSILKSKHEILDFYFSNVKKFGNEKIGRINKLIALKAAEKSGMKVPKTLLTTSKKELMKFIKEHKSVILKSQDVGFRYRDRKNNEYYSSYTKKISRRDLNKINDRFPLTLFQNYISKIFEIRCFYFKNNFFATAIFSQNNKKTKVDYRKYDTKFPNREVPIVLPDDLKKKIIIFFDLIKINTGSLDIIMNENDYFFLEVNPVGQFENVSILGNWYIEKYIADYLIKR